MATHTEVFNKDALVRGDYPTTNFGSDVELLIMWDTSGGKGTERYGRSLAYVDFSELDIVAGDVVSAYAYMRWSLLLTNGAFSVVWWRATADWDEAAVTWNTQPGTDATVASNIVSPSGGVQPTVWNITDMIKDAITNRAKIWNAVALTYANDPTFNDEAWYRSSEAVTEAYRPYIEINHTPAAGGGSRNRGYVFGSRLMQPEPPRGWQRRGLQGLMVPA